MRQGGYGWYSISGPVFSRFQAPDHRLTDRFEYVTEPKPKTIYLINFCSNCIFSHALCFMSSVLLPLSYQSI